MITAYIRKCKICNQMALFQSKAIGGREYWHCSKCNSIIPVVDNKGTANDV